MSTTILSPTQNAPHASIFTAAQTYTMDCEILASCVGSNGSTPFGSRVTLLLSSDGLTYVPVSSVTFGQSPSTTAVLSFHLADYAQASYPSSSYFNGPTQVVSGTPGRLFQPPWTNYMLMFTGNTGSTVTFSAVADSGLLSVPPAITLSAMLDTLGTPAIGDVPTRGASTWTLSPGGGGSTPTVITPSISASQNNWSPTGWLSTGTQAATIIQVSVTASGINLTGLVPPSVGTIAGATVTIQVAAASAYWVRLQAANTSSTAANRFGFLSDVFIDPGESIDLVYDSTSSTWLEATVHKDYRSDLWGSAKDGNVTATTGTLPRTMYYDVLTIPASVTLTLAGFDIYCNVLDISNASAGSIVFNGGNGGAGGASVTAGAAPASGMTAGSGSYLQDAGRIGGTGSTTNGAVGSSAAVRVTFNPLISGAAGSGGAGGTGTGAAGGTGINMTQGPLPYQVNPPMLSGSGGAFAPYASGSQGGSGGGGGGDGTVAGGGGGGSGAPGGPARINARKINRGTNTTAGIIQSIGGVGGAGGTPTTGSAGGGGGGAGASGGTVLIYHAGLFGSPITGAIDVSGGNGGAGGSFHTTGTGTPANGGGANSGPGGYAQLFDTRTGVVTPFLGSARVATGGQAGSVAAVSQTNL